IAVSASKLLPLLPPGYTLVPAASLGFGRPDQGLVAIANFRGFDPTVDNKMADGRPRVAINVAILVLEPAEAVQAGVSISGAFHLYALAMYTDDARYAASLRLAGMPVEFVNQIGYQRDIDDASGVGDLVVTVPNRDSPFSSVDNGQGYALVPGELNAVFWHNSNECKAVLHFRHQPFREGNALSRIFTRPHSTWGALFDGGGFGPCAPEPRSGYNCVIAPSMNLRYDKGAVGKLLFIR